MPSAPAPRSDPSGRRATACAVLAVLAALAVLATPAPLRPTRAAPIAQPDPDPTDAIVFADGAASIDLFSILPDGTGRRSLTGGAGVPSEQFTERLPDWSPDGAQVAFVASRSDGPVRADEAIWVLANDAAGAPIRIPLTFGPYDTSPDWSPDGTRIAFSSVLERGSPGQISSINIVVPGSADQQLLLTPLASPYATIEQPRWSPDGRRLVFVVRVTSDREPAAPNWGGELYIVNSDGSGARRLLARPGWEDLNPAWSPDGRYIAWDSIFVPPTGTSPTPGGIWLLDLVTGQVGVIVQGSRDFYPTNPKWSPNGRQIVVEGPTTSNDVPQLFVLDIAAPTPRAALTTGREPDWARRPLLPTPTPLPTTDGPTPTDDPSPATTATPSPSAAPATPTPPPIPGLTPFPTLNPFPTLPPREPTLPPIAPTWPLPTASHTPRPTATASPSPTRTSPATATSNVPTSAPGGRVFLPLALAATPLGDPTVTPPPGTAPAPTSARTLAPTAAAPPPARPLAPR
ncbi:MAG: PD40 domain-containing protein [Ardenticatenales bacterium]|nr:PD40 domain-containing protein [Ardenticatenales bacterium]